MWCAWRIECCCSSIRSIIDRAFKYWEQGTGLRFSKKQLKPYIYISFGNFSHRLCSRNHVVCSSRFDGLGGVLGHAFLPKPPYNPVEIHIAEDEDWVLNNKQLGHDLLSVMIHDIGHALGLGHSGDPASIMFPFYHEMSSQSLSKADLDNILKLYGDISTTTVTTTRRTNPTTTTTTSRPVTTQGSLDICKKQPKHFLLRHDRMYIFDDELYWVLPLNSRSINKIEEAKMFKQRLHFLPNDIVLQGVYERPNGNVMFFVNLWVFEVKIPSFQLISTKPISDLLKRNITSFQGVVRTAKGKTYIFYDGGLLSTIDECSFTINSHGYVDHTFPGVANNFQSIFQYQNGLLYFFHNKKNLRVQRIFIWTITYNR